jgi:undecaprenyl-diphosphatase
MFEILKVIILGIVQGITEWLPISSTGHMILVDEFLALQQSAQFKEVLFVVIQLGSIMAVVVLYWKKIFPFTFKTGFKVERSVIDLWMKIVVAALPAALIGILFDDWIDAVFYNYVVVALMLIVYGLLFIDLENHRKDKIDKVVTLQNITYRQALLIGFFQVLALIPGTSRSGATILGAMSLGISRVVAAEFTFFLAIPVMFGASALKLLKLGASLQMMEWLLVLLGSVVAFVISLLAIAFLIRYIKKHDFKVFGYYRIVLGLLVFIYFVYRLL